MQDLTFNETLDVSAGSVCTAAFELGFGIAGAGIGGASSGGWGAAAGFAGGAYVGSIIGGMVCAA